MTNILPKIVNIIAEATDYEFRMEVYGEPVRGADFETVFYLWATGVPLVVDSEGVKYKLQLHDIDNWSFDAQFASELARIMRAIEDVMGVVRMDDNENGRKD